MGDRGKVSGWAVAAVGWCFRNKILTGAGGNVNPAGNTARAEAAKIINETRENGGRIICVGTTSTRTVESAAAEDGSIAPCSGWTNIFIYPGYRFKTMNGLITNFHLPESTLIMLVSAFAGYEHTMNAYKIAVEERYRFFSFGDSMLIL